MPGAVPSSGFRPVAASLSGTQGPGSPRGRVLTMIRWLVPILLLLLAVLQYRLWVGEGSLAEVHALRAEIAEQEAEIDAMQERNAALEAEVESLRSGFDALEERARSELGMIKRGETFLQVIEGDASGSTP